jgi:hypothetical protein
VLQTAALVGAVHCRMQKGLCDAKFVERQIAYSTSGSPDDAAVHCLCCAAVVDVVHWR